MKINNTIFQTESFQPSAKKAIIDENDILYRIDADNIFIDASLIPFVEYDKNCFDYFFSNFQKSHYIKLIRAVQTENERLSKTIVKVKHFDNNYCLLLPKTIEEYRASLGKKTRMHLGQYLRHMEKELDVNGGGYYVKNFSPENKYIFDKINELNKERCLSKGFESGGWNLTLWEKLKDKGVLNYLMIGDEIVAGTISSIYNNQLCLFAIAHSNDYGKLNPGNCILYKTIENAIAKKIPVFNFLWGNCEYKSRFGAKEIQLFDYYICRRKSDYFILKSKLFVKKLIKKIKIAIKFVLRKPYHIVKRLLRSFLK